MQSHHLFHLERCPDCQRFYEQQKALVDQLRRETVPMSEPSPFLHSRIMNEIKRDERPAPRFSFSLAAVAVAAGLATVLIITLSPHRKTADREALVTTSAPQEAAPSPGSKKIALMELTQKLDQPLEKEMQSVVQDARSAVNLLAYNFLPERLLTRAGLGE